MNAEQKATNPTKKPRSLPSTKVPTVFQFSLNKPWVKSEKNKPTRFKNAGVAKQYERPWWQKDRVLFPKKR